MTWKWKKLQCFYLTPLYEPKAYFRRKKPYSGIVSIASVRNCTRFQNFQRLIIISCHRIMNVGHYTNIFALVKLLPTLHENPLVRLHHDLQSALVLLPILLPCKKSQHLFTSLEFFQKQKNFLVIGREAVFKFPVFEL